MDEEDESALTLAHRHLRSARAAAAASDWSSAIVKHRQTAQAFAKCAAATSDPQTIASLQLLVADQLETALRIATSLALRTQESAQIDERRWQRNDALSTPREQQLQPAAQDGSVALQIVHLVQVFLRISSAPGHMSFEQLQGVLQELGELSRRFGVNTRQAFASPSAPLPVSEEERIGRELQQRLHVAEQLHQQLEELELQGRGMDAAQLASFHTRFVELQKQQLTVARNEMVLSQQHAAGKKEADVLCVALERKLSQLVDMVASAAKQARTAAATAAEEHAALPSSLDASSMLMVAGASAFDAAAQLRQLQAEKAALEKQLASASKAVSAERHARLQAEKQNIKHEQRWKALEQKVAAKKAAAGGQASPAPSPSSSVVGSSGGGGSSSSSTVSSGGHTAPAAAADGGAGIASGSLARSNSGSSSASRSAAAAAPHALLSARPVKL